MTTIAYRDGIMAADTGMTVGDLRLGQIRKIVRHEKHGLCGVAGHAGFCDQYLRWFENGCSGDEPKASIDDDTIDRCMIVLPAKRRIIKVVEPEGWFEFDAPYYALGTGKEIALGCMWKGGSAEDAIAASLDHDGHTWGKVQVLRF